MMMPTTTRRCTWLVVADRQQARFFVHSHPGAPLETTGIEDILVDSHQDQNTDRPGRVHERASASRHAMEATTSYQEKDRVELGRRVSETLDQGFDHDHFNQLVLVAGPETLGEIRLALSDRVRKVLVGEVEKSVIHDTPSSLAARLSELEFLGRVAPK